MGELCPSECRYGARFRCSVRNARLPGNGNVRGFNSAREITIPEAIANGSFTRYLARCLRCTHRGAPRHLVHRDLKPENIFLVSTESTEIAKVLDFGVAKFISAYTEQRTADTATGAVLGTLRYMSPEQRGGQAAHQAWDL